MRKVGASCIACFGVIRGDEFVAVYTRVCMCANLGVGLDRKCVLELWECPHSLPLRLVYVRRDPTGFHSRPLYRILDDFSDGRFGIRGIRLPAPPQPILVGVHHPPPTVQPHFRLQEGGGAIWQAVQLPLHAACLHPEGGDGGGGLRGDQLDGADVSVRSAGLEGDGEVGGGEVGQVELPDDCRRGGGVGGIQCQRWGDQRRK